jgi:dolichol-phosphate mannosyltransferase
MPVGLHLAPAEVGAASENGGQSERTNGKNRASKFAPKKPELSVIVPTRNESENVRPLVERLTKATEGIHTEIVFVDDSDDETPGTVLDVARRSRCRVKLIHRTPAERTGGLGGAVVEGLRSSEATFACVMDGDLQHPPELVPELLEAAVSRDKDIVVASRYCDRGAADTFGPVRSLVSKGSSALAHGVFPRRLHDVTDPMSGFFLVRREAVDPDALKPRGFKILLEVLVRNPSLRRSEVPFGFGDRNAGESKASVREGMRFLSLLLALRFGDTSGRLARFAAVGLSGLAVNMIALAVLTDFVGLYYLASAILATQVSTLWNFALSEKWVFTDAEGDPKRSAGARLMWFLGMNNAALLLRGPMLYVLVSLLGVNYLVANFVSLVALTILRFALADGFIWAQGKQAGEQTYAYDVHGIVTVESDVVLPELELFRIEKAPARPSVRVRIGRLNRAQSELVAALAFLARHTRYDERLGRFGFGVDIAVGKTTQVVASPLLRYSPHVLYTNVVEPILRWTFAKKGYALVHAASIARDGKAFLITARTDTGKTTTILKLLDQGSFSFLSDDMTLLAPDGRIFSYPKPLTISRHTVHAVKSALLSRRERLALVVQSRLHSRSGRRFGMVLAKSRLPVATINAIVQLIIPPPKYHVDRLVPEVEACAEARLAGLFVIEREGQTTTSLSATEALDTLMTNCDDAYGFPPYENIADFLYQRSGTDLREVERAIVSSALSVVPATLLQSQEMDWAERLPGIVSRISHAGEHGRQQEAGFEPALA